MFLLLFVAHSVEANAQVCKASGKIRGRNPTPKLCNRDHSSNCCEDGQVYPVFHCSPPITEHTEAILTLNGLERGADSGGPSECTNKFHSDNQLIVALSTGWFNKRSRLMSFGATGALSRPRWSMNVTQQLGAIKTTIFSHPATTTLSMPHLPSEKPWACPPSQWGNLEVTWTDA